MPRLVQYCTASESVLEADADGPPWLLTGDVPVAVEFGR